MTGKVANMSNYPNGFQGGLMLDGLATHRTHSGNVFYVAGGSDGSRASTPNAKDPNNGNKGTYLDPFKTLTYAVEQCVDGRGDTIVCLPGMVDDIETALDIEAGNITILGLGQGTDRPQITPGVLNALDVEAENVTVQNMYFNEAPGSTTTVIDVVGTGFRLIGCHADLGANDTEWCTFGTGASFPYIAENRFVVTANGTDDVFDVEGVIDGAQFVDNAFIDSAAAFDSAAVEMAAVAATNTYFKDNVVSSGKLFQGSAHAGTRVDSSAHGGETRTVIKHGLVFDADDDEILQTEGGDIVINSMVMVVQSGAETGVEAVFDNVTSGSSGSLYAANQGIAIEVGDGLAVGEALVLRPDGAVDAAEADVEDAAGLNWLIKEDDQIAWVAEGSTTADGFGHLIINYTSLGGGVEVE